MLDGLNIISFVNEVVKQDQSMKCNRQAFAMRVSTPDDLGNRRSMNNYLAVL